MFADKEAQRAPEEGDGRTKISATDPWGVVQSAVAPQARPPRGSQSAASFGHQSEMRVLLVSNRLPVSVIAENHRLTYIQSIAGDGFCDGLSNSLLWPMFHGMPSHASFHDTWWAQYVPVCASEQEIFRGDFGGCAARRCTVDLLTTLAADAQQSTCRASYWLLSAHPPDPSIFDHLLFRDDLLEGILGSDQVGVYTDKYKSRLLDCIDAYVMRRNATPALPGNTRRATRIGVFPLGVDALRIRQLLGNAEARALVSALRTIFAGRKIILSADRLDYTKGIPQKLHAYDKLLGRYPEFRERVQLALIVGPSRMRIADYAQLNEEILLWFSILTQRMQPHPGSQYISSIVCCPIRKCWHT